MSGFLTASVAQGAPAVPAQRRLRGRGTAVFFKYWNAPEMLWIIIVMPTATAMIKPAPLNRKAAPINKPVVTRTFQNEAAIP